MTTDLTATELQRWMSDRRPFALIDVLPEKTFEAQRLPGARRASVYEVSFLDQVAALKLDPDVPVVLYGAGEGSLDTEVAAEKLERAGFKQPVYIFRGGRAEWAQAGGVFEGDGLPAIPDAPADRRYSVQADQCVIEWIGRNLNTIHHGTIGLESGHLSISKGQLAEGEIVLDMRSIANRSVEDTVWRPVLDAHLKSDDFFDVERYPTATLKIRSAKALPHATPGASNYEFEADLTLKETTRPIRFPAVVAVNEDGSLVAGAQIDIDRTQWNVIYGSGRFFKFLGMHLVNDIITLVVKIVAV